MTAEKLSMREEPEPEGDIITSAALLQNTCLLETAGTQIPGCLTIHNPVFPKRLIRVWGGGRALQPSATRKLDQIKHAKERGEPWSHSAGDMLSSTTLIYKFWLCPGTTEMLLCRNQSQECYHNPLVWKHLKWNDKTLRALERLLRG